MDHEVEAAPILRQRVEYGVQACFIADIAFQQMRRLDRFGQRLHPLVQRLALKGEGQGGTLCR